MGSGALHDFVEFPASWERAIHNDKVCNEQREFATIRR